MEYWWQDKEELELFKIWFDEKIGFGEHPDSIEYYYQKPFRYDNIYAIFNAITEKRFLCISCKSTNCLCFKNARKIQSYLLLSIKPKKKKSLKNKIKNFLKKS